jgi:cation transport ATPase
MNGHGTARAKLKETKSKRRYWAWLLVLPLLLLVYPGMYARTTPELFGFPFFYWYQFVVVVATALLTGVVYWLTRNRADE